MITPQHGAQVDTALSVSFAAGFLRLLFDPAGTLHCLLLLMLLLLLLLLLLRPREYRDAL